MKNTKKYSDHEKSTFYYLKLLFSRDASLAQRKYWGRRYVSVLSKQKHLNKRKRDKLRKSVDDNLV